jgi:hypothetical protein
MKKNATKNTAMAKMTNDHDPRLKRGFKPELWPLCNGQPALAPGASDPFDRRCLEFLAAYYQLNVLNIELLALRKKGTKTAGSRTLGKIDATTRKLEKLEDHYAPIGFFGEPVTEGILYRNIIFVRPKPPSLAPSVKQQSAIIPVPGLRNIPKSELRGRPRVFRFGYAKMDF